MPTEPLRVAASRHGGHWTTDDWRGIKFSHEEGWQTAIDIFEDRIRSRFLNVVDGFQKMPFCGFAVMALDCLLMETLQQFYEGKPETPDRKSGLYFRRFLTQTSFKEFFDDAKADMFFKQIRNGILHQGEVKGSSRIWIRKNEPVVRYADDRGGLCIHRGDFHGHLVREVEGYLTRLRMTDPPNADLRQKFVNKMNSICKETP